MIPIADDLRLYSGRRVDTKDHVWGPGRRSLYIIHYVEKGKGYFESGGNTYELNAGESFLIRPFVEVKYYTDDEDPWIYTWIDFAGEEFMPFLNRLHFVRGDCILGYVSPEKILPYYGHLRKTCMQMEDNLPARYENVGLAMALLGLYADESAVRCISRDTASFVAACNIIWRRYYRPDFTQETLCRELNISRATLHRSFRQAGAPPPGQYLLQYRLDEAKRYLSSGASVKQAALSCGFSDPLYFSRMFRRIVGVSPREYAKEAMEHPPQA